MSFCTEPRLLRRVSKAGWHTPALKRDDTAIEDLYDDLYTVHTHIYTEHSVILTTADTLYDIKS